MCTWQQVFNMRVTLYIVMLVLTTINGYAQFVGTPYMVPLATYANSVTFNYTGAQQSWTVPAGITKIGVELLGAQGGGTNGGKGGRVTAQLTVTPGTLILIVVGGQSTNQTAVYGFAGNGGNNTAAAARRGFAGGGLSGLFVSTVTRPNALAVAGGGGGNSGANTKLGGNAGAPNGTNGAQGNYSGRQEGGRGATQTAAGVAGQGFDSQSISPLAGGNLNGGRGGGVSTSTWSGGGGGGAGYFGGGGGAGGGASVGAGGGGSSFVHATLGSAVAYTSGFNTGNGKIIILY